MFTDVPVVRSADVPAVVLEICVAAEYKIILEPPVAAGNCKVMLLPSLERIVPVVNPAPAAPVLVPGPMRIRRRPLLLRISHSSALPLGVGVV